MPDLQGTCPNCGGQLRPEDVFCSHCGQKVPKGMPTVGELLGEFFSNFFNFDSKFFRTLRDVFVPGKLTQAFFAGIRKSYYTPFRLLIFSSFLFFATFSLTRFHEEIKKSIDLGTITKEYAQKMIALDRIDSTAVSVLEALPEEKQADAGLVIDSLKAFLSTDIDSVHFTFMGEKKWYFSTRDVLLLSPEELVDKYGITDFWGRIAVRQMSKTVQNPSNFVFTLIGNIFWLLLMLIPVMALVLKVLYWRQGRYYIEHLVFLLHQHSFFFIFGTIMLGLLSLFPSLFPWGVGLAALYFFLSMLRYYGQGLLMTFVKWSIFSVLYVIFGFMLFSGVMLVSFMVF